MTDENVKYEHLDDPPRIRVSYVGPPADPFFIEALTSETRWEKLKRRLLRRPLIEVNKWSRHD